MIPPESNPFKENPTKKPKVNKKVKEIQAKNEAKEIVEEAEEKKEVLNEPDNGTFNNLQSIFDFPEVGSIDYYKDLYDETIEELRSKVGQLKERDGKAAEEKKNKPRFLSSFINRWKEKNRQKKEMKSDK